MLKTLTTTTLIVTLLTAPSFAGQSQSAQPDQATANSQDSSAKQGHLARTMKKVMQRYNQQRTRAEQTYQRVVKRLREVRDQRLEKAKAHALAQLEQAQNAATEQANLEAALAIKAQIKQLKNQPASASTRQARIHRRIKQLKQKQDRATRAGELQKALGFKRRVERLKSHPTPGDAQAKTNHLRRYLIKLKVGNHGTTIEGDLDQAIDYAEDIARLVDAFGAEDEPDDSIELDKDSSRSPSKAAVEPINIDPAGEWTLNIPDANTTHQVRLIKIGKNRYRMNPGNLVYGGVYRLQGDKLIYANPDADPNFKKLVWEALSDDVMIETASDNYSGNVLERKSADHE